MQAHNHHIPSRQTAQTIITVFITFLLVFMCFEIPTAPAEAKNKSDSQITHKQSSKKSTKSKSKNKLSAAASQDSSTSQNESQSSASSKQKVTLLAVGDNLIHTRVYRAARQRRGVYNFSSLFSHVKKDIRSADIAVINQETMLVKSYPSGYPNFGTPRRAMARAISKAGFDVVQHATNHTVDRGTREVRATLRFWKKHYPKIKILGIHSSKRAAQKITVIERNGIKIAMLNYTFSLNGMEGSIANQPYLVDMLKKSKIRSDVTRAKKKADFVVVFAHMGTEYVHRPDAEARMWTKYFAKLGVDLMIGTHPHVLEPVKWIKGKKKHRMLAYYSLGNFVSAQTGLDRVLGGMSKVTIEKTDKGTRISSYKLVPLVTHIAKSQKYYTVYKLADYTHKLARKHRYDYVTVRKLQMLYRHITGRKIER